MKGKLAVVGLALGVTVVACQLVAGIERVEKVDPATEAGIPDVIVPDAAAADPCNHVLAPKKTGIDDEPNADIGEIFLALREVSLTAPDGGARGFDLDHSCTCDTRAATAFEGGASCVTSRAPVCDADGGIDNQAIAALGVYSQFVDLDRAANINGRIQEGKQTSIVVLNGYNGRANDARVSFGLFTSEGMLEGPSCPGSTTTDGFSTPGWCGEDKWTASESTVKAGGGGFIPNSVGEGFVTNYRFVVELNSAGSIPFGGYRLSLGSPVATGKLVPLDEKLEVVDTSQGPALERIKYWRIEDAILAGRIPATELLAAAGTINTPDDAGGGPKPPLCTSVGTFSFLKQQICDQIDINRSSTLDFVAGAKCDSLSVAVGLTAGSVRVTTVVPTQATTNVCYPTVDGGEPNAGPPGVDYRCP